jgi:hypothetical protein
VRKNAEGAADLTPLFPAVDMESRAEEIDQYSKFEEAPYQTPMESMRRSIAELWQQARIYNLLLATWRHRQPLFAGVPWQHWKRNTTKIVIIERIDHK